MEESKKKDKNNNCLYEIIINKEPEVVKNEYSFIFNKQTITLKVAHNSGKVSFSKPKQNIEDFLKGKYFPGTLNRYIFTYLLNYNEIITIDKCTVIIDSEKYEDINYDFVSTFSTVNGVNLSEELSEQTLVNSILKQYSSSDSRLSSINNYLLGINTETPIEKFLHLWMAFNGLYGFLSHRIKNELSLSGKLTEQKELELWGICHDLSCKFCFLDEVDHNTISNAIKKEICSYNKINKLDWDYFQNSQIDINLIEIMKSKYTDVFQKTKNEKISQIEADYEKNNEKCNSEFNINLSRINPEKQTEINRLEQAHIKKIEKIRDEYEKKINEVNTIFSNNTMLVDNILTSFGFILLKTTYYARCDLVHGTKKLRLFINTDTDIHIFIKIANNMLSQYLAKQYKDFFDESRLTQIIETHRGLI